MEDRLDSAVQFSDRSPVAAAAAGGRLAVNVCRFDGAAVVEVDGDMPIVRDALRSAPVVWLPADVDGVEAIFERCFAAECLGESKAPGIRFL